MPPRKRQYTLLLAVAVVAVLHLVVWQSTSTLRRSHSNRLLLHSKRSFIDDAFPLDHHDPNRDPETDALIDWLNIYRNATKGQRPLVFITMTLWLIFLFAFVGICASEFFCPNLSHIASRLGLSESVAGVTFLAFSNGSPDVFSTFSALKSDAGSLAIGELIGAASFIVSVVAGTMALITPFRVSKHTFLRDVGFFTLAVLLTLGILYDSHIHLWEALTMVGLYFVYVTYVGISSWIESRRKEKRRKVREARDEYDHESIAFENGEEDEEEDNSFEGVNGFASGGEVEWEPEEVEGRIALPTNSGSTTPRSTRSISPAFSTDSIVYRSQSASATPYQSPLIPHNHPHRPTSLSRSTTSAGGVSGTRTPPLISNFASSPSHVRSRSASLINSSIFVNHNPNSSSSGRPPPTPLIGYTTHSGGIVSTGGLVTGGGSPAVAGVTAGSTTSRRQSRAIRPSLLGAIEFRDVVNSLTSERNNAGNVLSVFGGGGGAGSAQTKGARGQSSPRSERGSGRNFEGGGANSGGGLTEWEWSNWQEQGKKLAGGGEVGLPDFGRGRKRAVSSPIDPRAGGGLRLEGTDSTLADGVLRDVEGMRRRDGPSPVDEEDDPLVDLSEGVENPWREARSSGLRNPIDPVDADGRTTSQVKKVPSILLTSANGSDLAIPIPDSPNDESTLRGIPPSSPLSNSHLETNPSSHHGSSKRVLLRATCSALFPSLDGFRNKSIVGKVTAIMCAPALLMLNLTLPVAEEPSEEDSEGWEYEKEEVEGEEREASDAGSVSRGVPKGIRLPDGDDGSLLSRRSDDGEDDATEVDGQDMSSRIGKRLHSGAVAHPHSHHFSNAHQHILEDPPLPSPWATEPVSTTTPLHSPLRDRSVDYFRIANASEGTVNHVDSSSPSSTPMNEIATRSELDRERDECAAARKVTRGLTAVQCTLGPVFCAFALFADELEWYQPVVALLIGLFFATLAYRFFHNPRHPGRVSLCFLGFGIAMVWILMIVNEVVGVLQTLGHIFGISDAILGLTIFAMGNSLGDLVANATVARMGYPSMAIAACFGGPMLNILLGVGLSGTYLIALSPTHEPIHVDMGRTLLVSGVGLFAILLGSLIVVPMNGFRMSKRIGAIFIAAYTVVLSINVAAEIWL